MAEEKDISTEAKAVAVEKDTKGKAARPEELKPGMTVRVYQKIKEINSKGEEKEQEEEQDHSHKRSLCKFYCASTYHLLSPCCL